MVCANEQMEAVASSIPPLHRREVTRLARFEAGPYQVLSLYLGTHWQAPEPGVFRSRGQALLHQAELEMEQHWGEWEQEVREAARSDLQQCRAFVRTFTPGSDCRGVAVFACAGRDWWQHFPLPRSVPDRYRWNAHPLALPTLRLLEAYPRTGVLLVDRHQARFFASRLGEVEVLSRSREPDPGDGLADGRHGPVERSLERGIEDPVRRHLKHVVAEARELFREWPADWLLIGGSPELFEDLRHCLPLSLRERWTKELELTVNAPPARIRDAVLAAEQGLKEAREELLLQELVEEWRSEGYGVVGVSETLRALHRDEVDRLVVDADLHLAGFRWDQCAALAITADCCPSCRSASLSPCDDLVTEAIEETFVRGGQVAIVTGAATSSQRIDFRHHGRLGALLHFRPS